ncbi:MAG: low molecular weight phosphotyrosine protein phosphatase [Myxococcota bacterium]
MRLLFVCSGNICRSPMAAALADRRMLALGRDVEVRSAGTLGLVDRPAEPRAVAVCREIGLDLTEHRSRPLTAELVRWADRIFVMEDDHARAVRELVPELREDAVVALGPLVGKAEIADPISSLFKGPYRTARDEIDAALQRALR